MYFVVLYVLLGASNFRLGSFKDVVLTAYSHLLFLPPCPASSPHKSKVTNSEILANILLYVSVTMKHHQHTQ